MMKEAAVILLNTDSCPICYAAGFSTGVLSVALLLSEKSDEEVREYLTEVMAAVYGAYLLQKKEAGHEDPPKSPDKRKLN